MVTVEKILKFKVLDNAILLSLFVLEIIVSLGLGLSILNILLSLYQNYPNIKQMVESLINNTLSIFIMIEIIKSINDYIALKRVRLSIIIDISIIILIRELVVGLYQHSISTEFAILLTGIAFILVIMRVITLKYSPNKYKLEV
ncbi:phosphate-starvation-inducible PsiE family protein [Sulfurihydrogenibium azorense]|uniref:phosphate-starvation-inducible PsiE family protein n=1 Tax=Sulfurihydrogenibium azorense TaxID=309806 RepID=UPI0024092112|nr:phosphate-starvation-inducible PsiE family protein [Sulfurihydrogenibium azorense]MDM7273618.1 phosphate-starvation-inducible PsiE family protein [Sulfurihydrogenibium azorense]